MTASESHPEAGRPDPAPPASDVESRAETARSYRPVVLAALTAALVTLCALLTYPFLTAITWGVALAILAWPMHHAIRRRVPNPSLAAALSTAAVVAVIVLPVGFVAYQISREAAEQMNGETAGEVLQEKLARVPVLGRAVVWMNRVGVDVEQQARQVLGRYTGDIAGLAAGSVSSALQALLAVFIMYFLFRDRSELMLGLRDLLPLSREEEERVFLRAADSVHATLYATIVTSLIDSAGFGLLFWWSGLPAPFLWTAFLFILSLLPVLGAALVWLPSAGYLAMTGGWGAAVAVLAWGAFTFVTVDNFLYVRLAGNRMRMHPVPAFIAFLGGVSLFGASGMILGPAAVAVTMAVLEVWKRRLAASAGAGGSAAWDGREGQSR